MRMATRTRTCCPCPRSVLWSSLKYMLGLLCRRLQNLLLIGAASALSRCVRIRLRRVLLSQLLMLFLRLLNSFLTLLDTCFNLAGDLLEPLLVGLLIRHGFAPSLFLCGGVFSLRYKGKGTCLRNRYLCYKLFSFEAYLNYGLSICSMMQVCFL